MSIFLGWASYCYFLLLPTTLSSLHYFSATSATLLSSVCSQNIITVLLPPPLFYIIWDHIKYDQSHHLLQLNIVDHYPLYMVLLVVFNLCNGPHIQTILNLIFCCLHSHPQLHRRLVHMYSALRFTLLANFLFSSSAMESLSFISNCQGGIRTVSVISTRTNMVARCLWRKRGESQ